MYHTLKGVNGWSALDISKIDIAKIIKISYHKRSFCIFDADHPYTLRIEYHNPRESLKIVPVYGPKGHYSSTIIPIVELTSDITKRYKTEEDVKSEIGEINIQLRKLEEYRIQIVQKIDRIELK